MTAGPTGVGQVGNALGSSLDPLGLNTQFGLRLEEFQEDQDGDTVERRQHNERPEGQRNDARYGDWHNSEKPIRPLREGARSRPVGWLRGRADLDRRGVIPGRPRPRHQDDEGMGTLP